MGTIWVREFTGGLDSRRMPETSPGGVLLRGQDGHITRGGEFEKRAAFVSTYELPEGTDGLAYTRLGVVVFGSGPEPENIPTGVQYQQLVHPEGAALISVPSFDLFAGKIYAAGVFEDGSRHHFYDGVRVDDWFDGRASAVFEVTAGGAAPAKPAIGSFEITGGSVGGGNEITSVAVDGVTVTSAAVAFDTDKDTTAAAVAANISAHTSSPNYEAYAEGPVVFIVAADAGTAANTRAVVPTTGGTVTTGSATALAGGTESGSSLLTSITVNGVEILLATIEWTDTNSATAAAIAAAINEASTGPEYTAIAVDAKVVILAEDPGEDVNGFTVEFETSLGFTVSPATGLTMSGGETLDETFQPGPFVKTIGSKMYALADANMHFSGIRLPDQWNTDAVGAGFTNMSTEASGSEQLTAVAKYQQNVAVFAESTVQIWFVDPDPTLNRQVQVLANTGTASPRSVTQFGDNDVFYLDSGVRSLRARDSSNTASTSDIGIAVDTLVTAKLDTMSADERARIIGLIEPRDKRFWLIMKDTIFVFSFFSSGARSVSAWTTYLPGFDIDEAIVFGRHVYLRSGDTIYVYGGLGNETQYDETSAIAQIPYLDAEKPTEEKDFAGVDVAARGDWTVWALMDPENDPAQDKVGVINGSTFKKGKIGGAGKFHHISLRLESQGSGPAKLGSLVIHYKADSDED